MALIFNTTFDDTNFPTIRAVGRSWDQTIDGLSDAAVGQVGDGITGIGGWTTTLGAGDQILTAANFSGGAGGKGFRHWVGNGTNNNGGSIQVSWSPVSELWLRYYVRFQSGFAWGSPREMKQIYCVPAEQGPFYWGLKDGYFGGHVQNDNISRTTPSSGGFLMGTGNFYSDGLWGWPEWQGGNIGDGNFHCVELHVKGNTGGLQNGTLEWKIDGVLRGSWANVRFGTASPTFQLIHVGENANNPQSGSSADQYIDYDDIAVSDSGWIGQISGDTTPPTLSSPSAGTATSDGCTGAGVSTNEANGTLHWAVVTNGGSCTDPQLIAGSGGNIVAGEAASQAVSTTGPLTIPNITALGASTTYQIKFLQTDAAGNNSSQASVNLVTTAGADTTAPVLSSPSVGVPTSQGCTGASVGTDEANGTLYWAFLTNGGSATDPQMIAGSGGNIVSGKSGNQAVVVPGTQLVALVNITGLSSSANYELKFLHVDAAGNHSTQASAHLLTLAPSAQVIFFTEGFEDSNAGMTARGWFDGSGGAIDNTVFSPNGGSAGSLKLHWQLGNTDVDPGTGARRHTIKTDGTETLYIKFDVKFGTAGTPWQGSGDAVVHPHIIYVLSDADVPQGALARNYLNLYIEAGDVSGGNAKPKILIQDNIRIDTANLNIDLLASANTHSVAGWNGHQDQATPLLTDTYSTAGPVYHNYTYWQGPTRSLLNNTWHTVEVYAAMNSISGGIPQANGIFRMWVGGVLQIERTNVYFRTAQFVNQGFETFVIAPFLGSGSPIAQDMWIDNLLVADQADTGAVPLTVPRHRRRMSMRF